MSVGSEVLPRNTLREETDVQSRMQRSSPASRYWKKSEIDRNRATKTRRLERRKGRRDRQRGRGEATRGWGIRMEKEQLFTVRLQRTMQTHVATIPATMPAPRNKLPGPRFSPPVVRLSGGGCVCANKFPPVNK